MTVLALPTVVAGLDSLLERLVVSVVLVGALGLAGWLAWRVGLSARRRRNRHVVEVLLGGTLLALVLVGGSALLAVWASTPLVQDVTGAVQAHLGTVALVGVTLLLLAAIYVGTGLVSRGVHEVADRRAGITEHQAEVVYRVLQVCIYGAAALLVLTIWQVNLGGLLVGAGFLGIVVGMAARQTLGSLIAGFVLMFARPFEIGDWVEIGEQEGIVTDITIVNTRIQTFDGEYVMLPNDVVSSNEVVNRTRKGRLRLHVQVGVDYSADLDRAVALAKEALGDVEEILSVPQPEVAVRSFGDSAVVIDLRFWIDKPSARRRWRAKSAVIRAVKGAFDDAGVKIPFPQREVMGREETGGIRMRGGLSTGVGSGDPRPAPDEGRRPPGRPPETEDD